MMSFATEFPIDHHKTPDDFVRAIKTWITGSPHTSLVEDDLSSLGATGEKRVEKDNEIVDCLRATTESDDVVGIRHARRQDGLRWTITAVFSRTSTDSWVGLRVWCESDHPAIRVPPAKKPVLVRTLLETLGGAADGGLCVGRAALRLRDTDIEVAARLILGKSGCRLPVVYVSAGPRGHLSVDADRLAADLAGMAHVVVEPNRAFSLRLMIDVNSENVYGGTVGIYWPDGAGRRSFFIGPQFNSQGEIAEAINGEIRTALTNRLGLERCAWAAAQEAVSRQAIRQLQASGSKEVQKYVETFDKELAAKSEMLEAADREIKRLRMEIRIYETRMSKEAGSLLSAGVERDFYPNEILGFVRDAVREAILRVQPDSRRQHVLNSIVAANCGGEDVSDAMREKVKQLLRGSTGVDAKIQRGLQDLGFSISSDGKHYKLVYHDDDRYTFTLSKTGSDHRGGLNAAKAIGRLFF